jgi:hypothetical protein
MLNTIADGEATGFDIRAIQSGESATVMTSHSNYATTSTTGGATITDDGTSQTAAPLFAAPLMGDFHELAGSPTIDAGITDPANGLFDLDGAPRAQGGSTDIGAYEFPQPAIPVTAPPTATPPVPLAPKKKKRCKKKKRKLATEAAKKKKCKKRKRR